MSLTSICVQKISVSHSSWSTSSLNRTAVVKLLSDLFPQQAKVIDVENLQSINSQSDIDVLVFFVDKLNSWQANLLAMEKVKSELPHASRLLVVDTPELDLICEFVNKASVHGIYEQSQFFTHAVDILQKAMDFSRQQKQKSQLRKQSTKQMRELESLNVGLENIVHERTLHIENSKIEEDQKLNQVRNLIRLIKDLALINSFDDLLPIVRKELRKFNKLGEPFILLQTENDNLEILNFKSGQVHFSQFHQRFDFAQEIKMVDSEMSQVLANHLGRPLIRTLYVPLAYQCAFAVELSMNENEMANLIDFLRERLQPMSLTAERLLLERELLHSSYLWEKTFDGFRDAIAILDEDYMVLRANKKFSAKSKQKCYQEFAGQDSICEGCPAGKAFENSEPQTATVRLGEKTYQVNSYPITLGTGRASNVVNQYIDITQKRDLYLRMLQSEKLEAMGLLAGNIAHELNNPLTGLRSLAQVLRLEAQGPGSEQLASDLSEIEKAAARSQLIIRNLLEFSQGGSVARKKISMDEIVQRTLPLLKSVMRNHRQNIHLDTVKFMVEVEPHLLQQVVFNLINNACQAMKTAGAITIETEAIFSSEQIVQAVRLIVQDSGPGIPQNLREKIFEPFFTTKKEGVGTGLGLSLAKKIIEAHSGHISLRQQEQGGACFVVELPVVEIVND